VSSLGEHSGAPSLSDSRIGWGHRCENVPPEIVIGGHVDYSGGGCHFRVGVRRSKGMSGEETTGRGEGEGEGDYPTRAGCSRLGRVDRARRDSWTGMHFLNSRCPFPAPSRSATRAQVRQKSPPRLRSVAARLVAIAASSIIGASERAISFHGDAAMFLRGCMQRWRDTRIGGRNEASTRAQRR